MRTRVRFPATPLARISLPSDNGGGRRITGPSASAELREPDGNQSCPGQTCRHLDTRSLRRARGAHLRGVQVSSILTVGSIFAASYARHSSATTAGIAWDVRERAHPAPRYLHRSHPDMDGHMGRTDVVDIRALSHRGIRPALGHA